MKKEETKKTVKEEKAIDLKEILLNEDNDENIILFDEDGNEISFEQVAVIPLKNEMYAILKPVDKIEGVNEDEAIVFKLGKDKETKATVLIVADQEKEGVEVFDKYYELIEEELGLEKEEAEEE